MAGQVPENLVDHFRSVFAAQPDARTYRYLVDGEGEPLSLTNAGMDLRARAIGAVLQERFPAGARALIVCPAGLDYVASFFGCLYAGAIAVPVYPPDPAFLKRTLPRLIGIIEDARPAVILAPSSIVAMADRFAEQAPALREIAWLEVDTLDDAAAAGSWRQPDLTSDSLAFLQYTSGSTSRPKGVMVGHGNLIHNLNALNEQFFGIADDNHMVTWLPPYHDMGLIAGLLAPAFEGYPVTFMSPFAFLKRPLRWLEAISAHRATVSGAPNFAYELCVAKSTEEERAALDLSSWRVTLNGAEPVRLQSMDRFSTAFAASGFRRSVFLPAYGLAEGTLAVAGGGREAEPVTRELANAALAAGEARDAAPDEESRTLVGVGWSIEDQEIAIVDPQTRRRVPEGRVGEIWLASPSVAHGYWERPELSDEIFRATVEDTGEGPFLRTGDLGFLDGTELFINGRIKDVIIVAGKNHYPQDIERAVEDADPALRAGCGVAGSREIDGEERLIVIQELNGKPPAAETERIITAIRARVAQECGLETHAVALVRRGKVPKTSSGKLQRAACLDAYASGALDTVAHWTLAERATTPAAAAPAAPDASAGTGRTVTPAEVEERLSRELATLLDIAPEAVDRTQPLSHYGLRSMDMVSVIGDLERWLERKLPATLAWEYPTVEAMARRLGTEPAAPAAPVAPAGPAAAAPAVTTVPTPVAAAPEPAAGPAEPVAIVGIGCRFPGADGPQAFWDLLTEGTDAVREVPADRWDVEEFFDEDPSAPGRTNARWGGFLDGIDTFDPQFFGISPQEAARMDPQQRLLAEVAYEALEDAGIPTGELAGSDTGVYVGISSFDYANLQLQDLEAIDAYTGTGSALSIAANRLSYLFDLRGPSMAVDSACSSSLVAVLQACAALRRGECGTALAAGVNVILAPTFAVNFSKAGVMSPDGRCKTFDASANGYVRSEGAGVVVLKPLSRALADRDTVYGVIRGGAVNQDGRSNGLMAPNPHAQEAVLRAAYADAGVRPERVQYVEAHGTGTVLGDPIEAKALAAVLTAGRDSAEPCLIGSVKSNIGHMEAAAGMGGLIKAALMVRHRTVPPSLHYTEPNPHIPFDDLALRVADKLQPWPVADGPALVGVSSFGFGGTNAHVVLEEAPRPVAEEPADGAAYALTVSARDPQALKELAARHADRLAQDGPHPTPRALAFAAGVRRPHHEHRLAAVAADTGELRAQLEAFVRGEEAPGLTAGPRTLGHRPRPVFVFSGQGARWWPLAADLPTTEPVFRAALERCDALLSRYVDWSLLTELGRDQATSRLLTTDVGQPALCAVQIALATLWRSWGIEPAAVVGHSVGEVAAAHLSGALGLEDALRIAVHRGKVIRAAVGKGRMAMAGISLDEARRILDERRPGAVWIAANNSPTSTVFSGDGAAVEQLARDLTADGVFCRVLESVEFASHCPQMEPVAAELWRLLSDLRPRACALPMLSTVTGETVDGTRLDAEYWANNLSSPVLFDGAITALAETGHDAFVEISPHPMLGDAVAERLAEAADGDEAAGVVVASLRRDRSGRAEILGELGRLYTAGHPVDWSRVYGTDGPMTPLPTYPWQRTRCWIDESAARSRRAPHRGHPALQHHVRSALAPRAAYWTARIDLDGHPYLRDHRVGGSAVLPASFLLDAALAGARDALGDVRAVVEDVHFARMTVVRESAEDTTLQLVCVPETADTGTFRLFSRGDEADGPGWEPAAHGRYRLPARDAAPDRADTLAAARARCTTALDSAAHYTALRGAGLEYGAAFQGVEALWSGPGEAVARLRPQAGLTADRDPYLVHPAVLDSALQALAAAVGESGTYLPVGAARYTLTADRAAPRWARARAGTATDDGTELTGARVDLYGEDGGHLGTVDGIALHRLDADGPRDAVADALLDLGWHPAEAERADAPAGRWLLLADRDGTADRIRAAAEARGDSCVTVTAGERYHKADATHYTVDPARPEDFTTLLAELRDPAAPYTAVVYAWALDADTADATALWSARDGGPVGALHLIQALAAEDGTPRLHLLTRGAQHTGTETAPADAVTQAALWGLARVAGLEHGELRPTLIDLDPAGGDLDALLTELLHPAGDDQLALRGGARLVPRLAPWTAPAAPDRAAWQERPFALTGDANHRILATRPGLLDSLAPTRWQRTAPAEGEIEIAVAGAGLNFNDVLKAMDICPGVPSGTVPLGGECAGTVTAVGAGVDRFAVGDRVMAVARSSMAAYATTDAALAAPSPDGLDDRQAAALPIAFLTVVYGLEYLAHLGKGEKVLIHSATGGVGLAALQIARRNGAEVFATAGTEEKRALLRDLGVQHVMDSRSLRFADEIREATDGYGVDVVLNSLAGEALVRSLELLAPGGRFVEIGKQDVYDDSHLGLGFLRKNRAFFAVDLEQTFADRPALIAELLDEVTRGFAQGDFTALPVTAHPYAEAPAAFAHMAKARHTGKIVLYPDAAPPATVAERATGPVHGAATYLVTGGLGGLGLETARYLVGQGARHLVLMGRSAPGETAERTLAELRGQGAEITVHTGDVSREEDVTAALDRIGPDRPLAGIVHAAGVLDDALLTGLDADRFRTVAAPKAAGAWHLHRATEDRPLDFFVLYSSAAALLGSASQANYATANAYLDGLARHRTARGLPALSISWGPWAEVGLAARPDRGGALAARGIESIRPQDGIAALDRLLRGAATHACVLPLDRTALRASADGGLLPPLLTGLLDAPDTAAPAAGDGEVRRALLAVEPGRRRRAVLVAHCRGEAAQVLGTAEDRIDTTAPLTSMGFDSLLSLELRKRLESSLRVTLPATLTWRYPTLDVLVPFLAERMNVALEAALEAAPDAARDSAPQPSAEPSTEDLARDLDDLDDSDIEALLLAKTQQIDEGREG
ncbi:SDR family NAD(P)-dependent oxidoreductase [Streptomyces sp. NPDC014733]|uniref:SDR family NAD(P)-dependent oxidoreductase n=1 Tax=Streptomyces sp. NPDC014733 TaxID=3364885 RepID=UPI0036F72093